MAIAALDIGTRRIGIAVSDSDGNFIHPLAVIERRSLAVDLEAIKSLLGPREVERIIVGLPLNMDGTEGRMARTARSFANRLEQASGLSVEFQDERLSSFEAEDRLAALGEERRGRKKRPIDALAAAVILESWFERKKRETQRG